MNETAKVRMLGPLSATVAGTEIELAGRKQQALLGVLALSAPHEVRAHLVLEALWGEDTRTGPTTPSTHTSRTCDGFSPTPTVSPSTGPTAATRLSALPDQLDRRLFERLVEEAARVVSSDPQAASDTLHRALCLCRGDPLGELGSEPWAQAAVSEMTEMMLRARSLRVDTDLALGPHRKLVGELETLVTGHPYREDLWSKLMLALYQSGRQTEALSAIKGLNRLPGPTPERSKPCSTRPRTVSPPDRWISGASCRSEECADQRADRPHQRTGATCVVRGTSRRGDRARLRTRGG